MGNMDTQQHQERVDAHFDARADFWRELYRGNDLWGVIHRQRRQLALDWIDSLGLSPGSHLLEVGCGAGLLALDLARRGFRVNATDVSQAMVEATRAQVEEASLAEAVTVSQGDAHSVAFPPATFDLVVALGVFPFLHSPRQALAEMRRVLRPGGHLLLTSDNRQRLHHLLDPALSPVTAPLRREIARRRTTGTGPPELPVHYYSWHELRQLLADADLHLERTSVLGYGPFTLFGRSPITEHMAIALHRRLQTLADRGIGPVRAVGAQHIVLVQRP